MKADSLAARGLVPTLPAALMLLLGLWRLDRGMWWDESTTYEVATRDLPDLFRLLHTTDTVHGLYYALLHGLLPPGAGDAVMLRLPSLLGMAAAAAGTAAIGRKLAGPAVGLTAGLVLAAMPLASRYAQEGRSYALVTATVVCATLLLLRALDRPTTGRWTGYAALVVLGTFLHLFVCLAVCAHGASLLAMRGPRRILCRWLYAALPGVVGAAVFSVYVRRQAAQVSWLRRPTWGTVRGLVVEFAGPTITMTVVTVAIAVCGVWLTGPVAGASRIRALALPWLLLPPGTLLVISLIQPLYNHRYVLYSLPALALLVAGGLNAMTHKLAAMPSQLSRRWRAVPNGLLTAMLGASMSAALFVGQLPTHLWLRSVESRSDDQTAVARLLGEHGRVGDAVVFVPGTKRGVEYVYRREFAGLNDVLEKLSPMKSATLTGTEAPAVKVRPLLHGQHRVWLIERTVRRPDRTPTSTVKRTTLRNDFRLVREETVWGLTVGLYVRKP
ncbi:glycosyltransferase family 39 protein [Streptomyces sp.]|uniref:glycosyltransferase family 39 protein n=1 Tax=Streptomyces sp. TaxID=1931 RepID=UPI002D767A0D|nr:glycosyltransferase family 39 protein [Streptomyces sp.]HET6354720.1 glycosyltransferase family 39 protein [Streptomyces sp.]